MNFGSKVLITLAFIGACHAKAQAQEKTKEKADSSFVKTPVSGVHTDKTIDFEEAVSSALDEAIEKQYNEIAQDSDHVRIDSLMEKGGIVAEDFQTLCDQDSSLIQRIGGGPTCEKLAKRADRVTARTSKHSCLRGVQAMMPDTFARPEVRAAMAEFRKERPYQGSANGGACLYVALEASGDYIPITIKNKAYGGIQLHSPTEYVKLNREMNDLFKGLQPGIPMSIDDITDTQMRKKLGDTAGGKYGHSATKRTEPYNFSCDFYQHSFNFGRYGAYAHACIPKDAHVTKEDAKSLLRIASQRRLVQQKNHQQQGKSFALQQKRLEQRGR